MGQKNVRGHFDGEYMKWKKGDKDNGLEGQGQFKILDLIIEFL